MQLRPGCILLFDQSLYFRTKTFDHSEIDITPLSVNEKYTGKMNASSVKKLRQAINLLIAQAPTKEAFNPSTGKYFKFKVNFITLTLSAPQFEVSDKEIKNQMLKRWILNMRRNFNLASYVWRAERQKNGNIHFHFVTDTFIPYDSIRDAWNHEQGKYHFIEIFRHRNKSQFPNSTDVHAIKNIRNLASYIVKYMTKDSSKIDTIEGKVWDCSTNLKGINFPSFEMSSSDFSLVNEIEKLFPDRFRKGDYCTTIPLNEWEMKKNLPAKYQKELVTFLTEIHLKGKSLIES